MNKQAITNQIIEELGLTTDPDLAYTVWWWPDHSNRNNVRLTKAGYIVMCKAMTPYEFPHEFNYSGASLKRLAKLETPYYVDGTTLGTPTITIFSKQLATMIKMYPSFERYVELINE